MPKLPGGKAVPWMIMLNAALIARDHWGALEPRDREELVRVLRKSHGRPGNLTSKERSDLLRIVRLLDPITAGRRLMPFNGGVRGSKRRRP